MTSADDDAPEPDRADRPPGAASRTHDQVVGDAALSRSTGRSREQWYALLDAVGASGWRHREIASWLVREHGVDGWWAQGITVGYEQARGMRAPGQRQDGTFACSVSRVLPVDRERVWVLLTDDDARAGWLDVPVETTGATAPASVRWRLPDGTRTVARVEPVRPGATRVVVQHARLPDADAVAASRAAWRNRLERLTAHTAGS